MDLKDFIKDYIDVLDDTLAFLHGTPDHNNKEDPLDELIFILLSRRTRGKGYEKAYNNLKRQYPTWDKVSLAKPKSILKIIKGAGLGPKRVEEIQENLIMINQRFDSYSLDRLYRWNNPRVIDYLLSLKGVGRKTALCVMLYSLGRKVFPADTHVIRICKRMGLIDRSLDHKQAQLVLEDYFPERFRYSLHVNMVSHGREICKSINPKCNKCIISGFCEFNRREIVSDGPKVMDLFAGPGGMSLGFERGGFELLAGIEGDRHAASTFLFNRPELPPDRVINEKIENLNPKRFLNMGIKVLVAGPPCQEFSKVKKNNHGERGRKELYKEVLRFVGVIKPQYVVIENVPGMASHINRAYVDRVEEGLSNMGYRVRSDLINAKRYGIPQNRIRLFFIARKILRDSPDAAEKSVNRIWDFIEQEGDHDPVTFSQGVSGLPRLEPGQGTDVQSTGSRGRRSEYAKRLSSNQSVIFNHIARPHNPRDLEAYSVMQEGDNAIDLHRKRPDLMRYSTSNFPTKYFKIRSDGQSPTIVAHLRRDANSFIHPLDNRGITPREAARIQSFPDSYRFLGSFGIQFEQIGNAVPPLLAEVIANAIFIELNRNKKRRKMGGA